MSAPDDPQAALRDFRGADDFFVGIDSDGCAFDTMEVKHKECFIPNIIRYFDLAAVSKYAREVAEFVNLYSRLRGINRFPGLVLTLDLLAERPEVARRGLPAAAASPGSATGSPARRSWATRRSGPRSSGPTTPTSSSPSQWSEAVNRSIGEIVHDVPPFPFVRESLAALDGRADVMVVSATPAEARRPRVGRARPRPPRRPDRRPGAWAARREHLALAAAAGTTADKVLMIGDAPGDLDAAEANGVLFYPIDPGREDESWRRFHDEALPRFFAGTYAGRYMAEQVARFEALLPETPPWMAR